MVGALLWRSKKRASVSSWLRSTGPKSSSQADTEPHTEATLANAALEGTLDLDDPADSAQATFRHVIRATGASCRLLTRLAI